MRTIYNSKYNCSNTILNAHDMIKNLLSSNTRIEEHLSRLKFFGFILIAFFVSFSLKGQTTQTFSYTGSPQSFVVPAGVTSLSVKIWGAGGAGSDGSGGSGAFLKGTLAVTSGQALTIVVGGGGSFSSSASSAGGYGGGGASGGASGGSGGGYSSIFSSTTFSQANVLALAGGGGGGGYYGDSTYGGAGGATSGTAGGNGSGTGYTSGTGGTTSAGGTGGRYNGTDNRNGYVGTALQGGAGNSFSSSYLFYGGGGGGGYFGGGGGFSSGSGTQYASAGGGGSSFLSASLTSPTNLVGVTNAASAATQAPGNTETGYVTGVGNGGSGERVSTTGKGGNGLIIITYTPTTPYMTAGTLTAFGNTCINTATAVNSFTLSGGNLSSDITVGALNGYSYSTTSGGTYTSTLTLSPSSGSISQTVYVKFSPLLVQSYSGNIPITGGGLASTVNVAASGSGVNSTATLSSNGTAGTITQTGATISGSTISALGCSSVTAYGIEYSTTAAFVGGTGTQVVGSGFSGSAGGTFTTTIPSGLLPATTYYYRAYATNGGGTSYFSSASSFTTACTIPNAPSNVVISNVTSTTLTVSFTAASPVPTGYMVFLSTTTTDIPILSPGTTYNASTDYVIDGKSYRCVISNGTATSYDLVGGTPNTQHYYFVFSRSSTNSCAGAPWYSTGVTGSAKTCLATPTSSAGTAVTSSGFTANWASVAGATGYLLDVSTSSTFGTFVTGYNGLAVTGTSQAVTGLSPTTSYYYRVRATSATSCTSANSAIQTVITPCAAVVPTYTNNFSTFPGACWNANLSDGTVATGPSGTTALWFEDGFLNSGSTGAARINLYSSGRIGWLKSAPINLSAGGYRVKFNYGVTGFNVTTAASTTATDDVVSLLISIDGGVTWTALQTWNSPNSSISNTSNQFTLNLTSYTGNNTVFAFYGSDGTVDNAPDYDFFIDNFTVEAIPSCEMPVAPFSSAMVAVNNANISWTAPATAPANGYEYYLSTTNTAPTSGSTITGSVGAGVTTANITTGLIAGNTYYWWVRSNCNGIDKSAWVSGGNFYYGHCIPSSSATNNYISNFTTTKGYTSNISNTSTYTTGGYQDNYATQKVEMYASGTVDFSFTSIGGSAGTAIWIDWNKNLVFESSERVYGLASYVTSGSGSITVPAGTANGDYRMRVRTMYLSNGNVVDPCNSGITRSEAEDYKFTVVAQPDYLVYTDAISPNNTVNNTIDVYLKDFDGVNNFYTDGQTSIWMYAGVQVSSTSQFQYIATTSQDANNTSTLVEFVRQSTNPNVYKATIKFADYFCIPAGTTVEGVNLYFRNQNSALGNDKTTDLFLDLGDASVAVNAPTVTAATSVTNATATINWTAPASGVIKGYDYYYSTSSTAPTLGTTVSGSIAAGTNTANLTSLTSSTLYYVWVRTKGCGTNVSAWSTVGTFTTMQTAATLDYIEGFEGANNWTLVNGAQTNKWFISNFVNNGGTRSLYISNTATGTNNDYTNTTSTVQAYRDIAIPAGTNLIDVNFDWRAVGETGSLGTYYDYFKVWMVPVNFTPTAGTAITAGTGRILLNNNINQQAAFATKINTNVDVSSFAGQTMRLVFEWINDNSTNNNTAAAIDNLQVKASCATSITSVTNGSTCGTGSATLSAVGSTGTTEYRWYTAPEGGTPVATTTIGTWSTPIISATTTYYVAASNGTCESTLRSTVTASVLMAPSEIVLTPTVISSPAGATDIACALDYVKLEVVGGLVPALSPTALFSQNFTGIVGIPAGWSQAGNTDTITSWYATNSNDAGGSANEMHLDTYDSFSSNNGTYALRTSSINTTNWTELNLSFKQYIFNFNSVTYPYSLKVQSSLNGTIWTDQGIMTLPANEAESTSVVSINLTGVDNAPQVYLRFALIGRPFGLIDWSIDDVVLTGKVPTQQVVWSPATGLYTDTALTVPYVANSFANIVYAAPETATSFKAEATIATCSKSVTTASIQRIKKEFRGPGTDWNTAANWFPAQVPDNTKCANIPATQTVVIGTNAVAKSLTIVAAGKTTITAGNSLTITDAINITNNATNDNLVLESDANLLQVNNVANTGNMIAKRDATNINNVLTSAMDYVYWSSPVSGQFTKGAAGFSPGTPNNRFYQYKESTDTFTETPDLVFIPGKGYSVRAETGPRPDTPGIDYVDGYNKTYQFTGVPNNGDITFDALKYTNSTHGYNLVGNPYPSNIDFDVLYSLNSSKIYNSAWFWTNENYTKTQAGSTYKGNNYAVYNGTGGTPPTYDHATNTGGYTVPNGIVKVGQGFIVQTKAVVGDLSSPENQKLQFKNTNGAVPLRTNASGTFFQRNASSKNRFWLSLMGANNMVNTILVGYIPGATNNFETDYDGELFVIGSDSFYSILGAKKLAIQGKSDSFTTQDVIPLGNVYSANGEYTISLKNPEGIFNNGQTIYLRDKLLNKYIDITSLGSYTFSATKGTNATRFEIVYKDNSTLGTDSDAKSEFTVYRDANYFVVQSSKKLGNVEVYDAGGRLVRKLSSKENQLRIDAADLPSAVYIIKAENSGDVRTKKIIK